MAASWTILIQFKDRVIDEIKVEVRKVNELNASCIENIQKIDASFIPPQTQKNHFSQTAKSFPLHHLIF